MPRCLDGIIYVCWLPPAGVPPAPVSEAEREYAKDMQVGDFNFKSASYRGAELRFRDALDYKPNDPDATFWLARSIDKLGRSEDARDAYRAYLQLQPDGPFAAKAQQALEQLAKKSAKKK
jgi:Flp pilus assembly protein TadD